MKQAIERQTQEEQPVWNSMHRTANLQYKHRLFTTPAWYRLAAVFIGLLMLCGLYLWFANTPDIVYRTRYGQTTTIILPDKSSVTLNGNSSLRYSNNWNVNKSREVWLEGEAFFSVVHKSNDETFTVYTRDAMNVQVLGTQFNVTSRAGITQVVLSSGKVRLDMPANASRETLLMEPGELVEFNASKAQYSKKQVDTRQYIAWKDNILIFDNTSLKEIAGILHHTYGLQVTIKDTTLWKETISGSVPSQDVSVILAGLAKSFNLTFTQSTDKKEIIISR
jgi:ferric-dicitrate binding protein FerR (iron transport regulator)